MEEVSTSNILDGEIVGIKFGLATHQEICTASISDCSISHASQLSNPFLGLPLEFGKCESCGTSEPGKCEGHFGYIELPVPIFHPNHVSELKRMLSLLCLKCLKMKKNKFPTKNAGLAERMLASCCEARMSWVISEGFQLPNSKSPDAFGRGKKARLLRGCCRMAVLWGLWVERNVRFFDILRVRFLLSLCIGVIGVLED